MKKILLLPFGFLVMICVGHAQLKWLNPQPAGYINTTISFTNSSTGYVINENGDLFTTKDGGNSWLLVNNFQSARTFKINETTGVIPLSYDSSYYLSTDNGLKWERKNNISEVVLPWVDIVGRDTIFLQKAVNSISLLRSNDRGNSWQTVTGNIDQVFVGSIDFITSSIGYARRADGIYKTIDGGHTWDTCYGISNSSNVTAMKFYDTAMGFASRESFGILKTTDGGRTWTNNSFVQIRVYDIFFVDRNTAYAAGEGGVVYKTTDGGSTWNFTQHPNRGYQYDLTAQYFINANTGFVAGFRGQIAKTTDGGNTWKDYAPTYVDVAAVSFGDKNTGYAVTWNNVYKTADAGKNWAALPVSTDPNALQLPRFEHCRFVDKNSGFVTVNNPSRMYLTNNGGQTWDTINPGNSNFQNISAVSFFSDDTGYVSVKNNDYYFDGLYKTMNRGYTWHEIGTNQDFDKLHFVNNQLGYAVRYADIFRTRDGGTTWTQMLTYDYTEITAISFINASKGFIGGRSGYLKMTVDSGKTWVPVSIDPGIAANVTAIKFYNNKVGFITDDNLGRVYRSVDGGLTWKQFGNPVNRALSGISFKQDTAVIISGLFGTILSAGIDSYTIDSVMATPAICGAYLSGVVTAVITKVDSVFFEYGTQGFSQSIKGSPSAIADTTVKSIALAVNLSPDSVYKMRMKLFFKGGVYYSKEIDFVTQTIPAPVINATFNLLSSSYASGNQWYYNGSIIAGATSQNYLVGKPGQYTVKVTQDGCTVSSAAYNFIRPFSPAVNGKIRIYPNPVRNEDLVIFIRDYMGATLSIYDLFGRNVVQRPLTGGTNRISLSALQRGGYFIKITSGGVVVKNGRIMKL